LHIKARQIRVNRRLRREADLEARQAMFVANRGPVLDVWDRQHGPTAPIVRLMRI
jgi:hypothetical protein